MRPPAKFQRLNCLLLLVPLFATLALWRYDFLAVQVASLAVVLAAVWITGRGLNWTARPPQWCAPMRHWSRRPLLCCAIPAVLSIVLRLALLPWIPPPHPVVPDEYSHLFLAKTFLAGRLTNPPHPLWQHFETVQILSQPTYSSMYMAGQACFLALGKIITGSFFGGVLISTALACAALTWFLRALLPPGWALFGGLLAAVRFGAASYWNSSFWGGSAGALGGALVLGGALELMRSWRVRPAVTFTVGAVVLANVRPYEGFGLTATLLLALAANTIRRRGMDWPQVVRCVAISVVIFAAGGWAMTRQWKAVTGNALTMPYVVNFQTYGWPMTLPFTKPQPHTFRHRDLQIAYDFEAHEHQLIAEPALIPFGLLKRASYLWLFFMGPALTATLLFADRILRSRRMRLVWIAAGVTTLQVLTEQSGFAHYIAPAAPAILLFLVRGLQYLSHWTPKAMPLGPAMVRFAVPLMLLTIGVRAAVDGPGSIPPARPLYYSWCCTDARFRDREFLVRRLNREPGKQLVLLESDQKEFDTDEWVYNEPDIDSAKIVFADDMGPEKNQELLDYYPDRRVWRVRITDQGAELLTAAGPTLIGTRY